MNSAAPKGPFCQSCGMPLEKPEDFGTAASGFRVNDYCCWCYEGGAFTEPDISMERMIDKCAAIMGEQGVMPEEQARSLMAQVMPELKRWKKC